MSTAGYGIRVSGFFAALFLIYGVLVPYLPVWLEWRGLTAGQIAVATSLPFFVRLLATPSLAYLADRSGNHAGMIQVLAVVGLVASVVLTALHGFWPILAMTLLLTVCTYTIMPLTETVAIGGVRQGLDYGRMRLWGSLTFIAASFAGGMAIDWAGRGIGVWLIVAGCVATVAAALVLPDPNGASDRKRRRAAREATGALEPPLAPVPPRRGIDRSVVLRLVRDPLFLVFLVGIGTVQAAHATFYTFGAIHWRNGGLSSAWVGSLWAIGVLTEVTLFAFSGRVVALVGPVQLMVLGGIAAVARWAAMSLDPSLGWLIPLQVLHGLTYGASHLGAIYFINRAVPETAGGTAQALYATLASGVLQGAATLLSGVLYARYASGAYLAMSLIAAVGLTAQIALLRAWSGGPLWIEKEPSEATASVR